MSYNTGYRNPRSRSAAQNEFKIIYALPARTIDLARNPNIDLSKRAVSMLLADLKDAGVLTKEGQQWVVTEL